VEIQVVVPPPRTSGVRNLMKESKASRRVILEGFVQ